MNFAHIVFVANITVEATNVRTRKIAKSVVVGEQRWIRQEILYCLRNGVPATLWSDLYFASDSFLICIFDLGPVGHSILRLIAEQPATQRMSSTACLDSSSEIVWEKLGTRTEDLALCQDHLSILSFPRPFLCGLPKSYAGATPVLIDELDAGDG
jgi:hypothetical protein